MRDKLWAALAGLFGLLAAGGGGMAFDLSSDLQLQIALVKTTEAQASEAVQIYGQVIQQILNERAAGEQ